MRDLFELVAWLIEKLVVLWSAFQCSWFAAVRPASYHCMSQVVEQHLLLACPQFWYQVLC